MYLPTQLYITELFAEKGLLPFTFQVWDVSFTWIYLFTEEQYDELVCQVLQAYANGFKQQAGKNYEMNSSIKNLF